MNYKIVFGLLLLVLIVSMIIYKNQKISESKITIDFVIDSIDTTPALRCRLYDNNGIQLKLNSYTFYSRLGLKKGDHITKSKDDSVLFIYRKNNLNQEYLHQTVKPN